MTIAGNYYVKKLKKQLEKHEKDDEKKYFLYNQAASVFYAFIRVDVI